MQNYFDRPGGFALETSNEAIRLLYDLKGEPTVLGDASTSDPQLNEKMTELHAIAQRLVKCTVLATIVLPTEYVLFQALSARFSSQADQDWEVEKILLEKQLKREDVSVHCRQTAERLYVAIVERQTLREAARFAAAHRFWASRFIARPPRKVQEHPFVFPSPDPLLLQVQN